MHAAYDRPVARNCCARSVMRALGARSTPSGQTDLWRRGVLVAALLLAPAGACGASPSALCAAAIAASERNNALPRGLLAAIGRVESGRPDAAAGGALVPWPWTIDADGAGHFYASKAAAVAAARMLQASGVRSIDVGCLQVNLAHHPAAFRDLDEAFDPAANVTYGARFLRQLFRVSGNWALAAAAYHSATPQLGAAYRERVFAQWGRGRGDDATPTAPLSPYGSWPPPGLAYAAVPPMAFAYRAFAPGRK